MKYALMMSFALGCLTIAGPAISAEQPVYDAELAQRLGADDFGMRRYVMAFLKAGPDRSHDREEAMRIQSAHMANIRRMADDGTLVLAGPFLEGGELRGIYVFAVESVEEARALTETDPAVQSGRLIMELHPWYGTAALMEVYDISLRISKGTP